MPDKINKRGTLIYLATRLNTNIYITLFEHIINGIEMKLMIANAFSIRRNIRFFIIFISWYV